MPERMPNIEKARINPDKLHGYALNPEHSSGRYKTEFFRQMGYTQDRWRQLERDIREQHLTQPADLGQASPYGQKYVITATLQGPLGPARQVTTVWLFRSGTDFVELITKEPAARQR